jgi:hypothetical protein
MFNTRDSHLQRRGFDDAAAMRAVDIVAPRHQRVIGAFRDWSKNM